MAEWLVGNGWATPCRHGARGEGRGSPGAKARFLRGRTRAVLPERLSRSTIRLRASPRKTPRRTLRLGAILNCHLPLQVRPTRYAPVVYRGPNENDERIERQDVRKSQPARSPCSRHGHDVRRRPEHDRRRDCTHRVLVRFPPAFDGFDEDHLIQSAANAPPSLRPRRASTWRSKWFARRCRSGSMRRPMPCGRDRCRRSAYPQRGNPVVAAAAGPFGPRQARCAAIERGAHRARPASRLGKRSLPVSGTERAGLRCNGDRCML